MPNESNILRPIAFIGLGRSGTSAMTEMLGSHPQIDNVGEVSPVIWDVYEGVRTASANMRYPSNSITRATLPASAVRKLFLENFQSTREVWVIKPIGLIGRVKDQFVSRQHDEAFVKWFMGCFRDCFPEASVYTIVRDPIDYAISARRYWGAPVSAIVDDLRFMSALLKFGGIAPENVIPFAEFRTDQARWLEKIAAAAGLRSVDLDHAAFDKQYASEQGRAVNAKPSSERLGVDFSEAEMASFYAAVGEEYDPFIDSDRAKPAAPTTDEPQHFDYKASYLSLMDEYHFLKTRADGMETLVNEKEDIIQRQIAWIKVLDRKAEQFAQALLDNGVKIPDIK